LKPGLVFEVAQEIGNIPIFLKNYGSNSNLELGLKGGQMLLKFEAFIYGCVLFIVLCDRLVALMFMVVFFSLL
jgi:hypothetical protein